MTKSEKEQQKFAKVDYTFWQIDSTTFSTYPLKGVQKAYEELKSGLGFVAEQPTDPKVSITSVYLAYYQSLDYSPYLQPVYVFEGPNFNALVSAVANP